jgi:hypothetical protein
VKDATKHISIIEEQDLKNAKRPQFEQNRRAMVAHKLNLSHVKAVDPDEVQRALNQRDYLQIKK